MSLLHNGSLYMHKRDKFYRPICIINVEKMVKMTPAELELV